MLMKRIYLFEETDNMNSQLEEEFTSIAKHLIAIYDYLGVDVYEENNKVKLCPRKNTKSLGSRKRASRK